MSETNMVKISKLFRKIVTTVQSKQEEIHRWLEKYEAIEELPLYSSVDIRTSQFKTAVVDTNIFPAGFNNLCEHGIEDSLDFFKKAIFGRVPECKNILIVAEEHTRNAWYLENIRILQSIIEKAGFKTNIATFLDVQPTFCENAQFVQLETATGAPIKIYCFKNILKQIESKKAHFDLIILNNDLTTGIPELLKNSNIPIYPSIQAGWHSRLKSHHFCHTSDLIKEFAEILDMDPWFFSCIFSVADQININNETHRQQLKETADRLFAKIKAKYKEHKIDEKPYIFIKSDSGTYGMGILPIEDPREILDLNRKSRNKLHVGKSSKVIERYLLQEGVPSIYNIGQEVSEVCIYQIENNLVGGFYRSHTAKTSRESLNTKGMQFKKMCPHLSKYGDCGVHHDINIFDIYRILARIAAIAAHREIIQLEAKKQ